VRPAVEEGHLGGTLGVEVLAVETDRVQARLPFRNELRRGGGILHGAAIMALAERRGRTVMFLQIDVHGEASGRTIATCRATYPSVPKTRVGASSAAARSWRARARGS
jgi:acyl-coenzyme A thioesterase PaaI-like protein